MAAKKAAGSKVPTKKTESSKTGYGKTGGGKPTLSREAKTHDTAVTKNSDASTAKEKQARLKALRSQLGDKLIPADKLGNVYALRRPTGIVQVDIALGGGFPAGGACMLSGIYNSGKSWMLYRAMAMQQQIYGDEFVGAVHVAETQMPYDQMRQAGMKICVPDSYIKQCIQRDIDLGLPMWTDEKILEWKTGIGHLEVITGGTGEEVLETVIDCVKANVFSLIGVDSIQGLMPQADVDKDISDENKRAARAVMMGKFWERYTPHVNKGCNTTSVVFIQQVRASDSTYGKDWKVTGGKASEHFKLIDLALWPGQQIRQQIDNKMVTTGKVTKFETLKGKAGTHDHITGEFDYKYSEFYPGNVDVHGDLIATAIKNGILQTKSSGVQLLNAVTKEPIEGMFAASQKQLRELMEVDFDFELDFRRHVMASVGIKCLYR